MYLTIIFSLLFFSTTTFSQAIEQYKFRFVPTKDEGCIVEGSIQWYFKRIYDTESAFFGYTTQNVTARVSKGKIYTNADLGENIFPFEQENTVTFTADFYYKGKYLGQFKHDIIQNVSISFTGIAHGGDNSDMSQYFPEIKKNDKNWSENAQFKNVKVIGCWCKTSPKLNKIDELIKNIQAKEQIETMIAEGKKAKAANDCESALMNLHVARMEIVHSEQLSKQFLAEVDKLIDECSKKIETEQKKEYSNKLAEEKAKQEAQQRELQAKQERERNEREAKEQATNKPNDIKELHYQLPEGARNSGSTSINNNNSNPQVVPAYKHNFVGNSGTFTDERDGQTYKWVRIGNQVWMAENLRYNAPNSEVSTHCGTGSGRRYREFVSFYRTLCPKGWRIPSPEDVELLMVETGCEYEDKSGYAGMYQYKYMPPCNAAFEKLKVGGATGFNALECDVYKDLPSEKVKSKGIFFINVWYVGSIARPGSWQIYYDNSWYLKNGEYYSELSYKVHGPSNYYSPEKEWPYYCRCIAE
jgi:uncharacterized protein (TIGR02145 family)